MKILDIDLDFFLNHKSGELTTSIERLDDYYKPWSEIDVRRFLEINCGLNSNEKIKGKIFVHHVELFEFLRLLQEEHDFKLEFSVDHIDAHADLGVGDASYAYISTEILNLPLRERAYPHKINGLDGLGSGNFLAFALACRWLSDLKYINQSEWFDDLQWFHFENFNEESSNLQLKKYHKYQLIDITYSYLNQTSFIPALELEPLVPFERINYDTFQSTGDYDYIFLTQSPGFTPASSDSLIPLIKSYIDFD